MALSSTTNNPGNLTVTGPNSYIYPGQNGVYQGPSGLYYATFPDANTGSQALNYYVGNNVGTNSDTSLTTPAQLGAYYLNGNYNTLSPTVNNPNPNSYVNVVSSSLGIGSNDSLTGQSTNSISAAIAKAEGSTNYVPQNGTSIIGGAESAIQNTNSTPVFGNNVMSSAVTQAGQLMSQAEGFITNPIGTGVNDALGAFSSFASGNGFNLGGLFGSSGPNFGALLTSLEVWIQNTIIHPTQDFFSLSHGPWIRLGLVVLGGVLIIVAITTLLAQSSTVQKVARTAAMVAA